MTGRVDLPVHRNDDRTDAGPDGNEIPPTGKSFAVDFFTVAKWDNAQIVEENPMYDLVTFMKQIGLSD